jgi:oligopeptide/dipeptide ABC transporter ATP-binding protein
VRTLLEVENLKKYFAIRGSFFRKAGLVKAVDGVSFSIQPHQTFGLAGETGCGKTTLARNILRILPPTSGSVELDGQDIYALKGEELKGARRKIQAIFQNPFVSLDPRMTVQKIIAEPLTTHRVLPNEKLHDRIIELLERVGLNGEHALKYPHELSGGQNQRVALARAIALSPSLLILDEPTSSLDVSVQAQILNLLTEFQQREGLAYLFISHDLSVLRYLTDVLAIMYLGRIVEIGPSDDLFGNPAHPYTQLLLVSIPELTLTEGVLKTEVEGEAERFEPPPAEGCKFYPRCPFRMDKCKVNDPLLYMVNEKHHAACFLHDMKPVAFYHKSIQ